MEPSGEPVIFEAHPASAKLRRVLWWVVPLVVLPTTATMLAGWNLTVSWLLVGLIPLCGTILMPRLIPVRVELDDWSLRFGSGLAARRISYDDVLVVDVRRPSEPEDDLAGAAVGLDDDKEDTDRDGADADDGEPGGVDAFETALQDVEGGLRVTVHANLVPVSIGLGAADATAMATALHRMCPRAALWDADGRLFDPIDPAAAAASLSRVKRMATTRRVVTMLGGLLSFGAFGSTFGGVFSAGVFGQMLPYVWLGVGAGLLGLAAGAEKSLQRLSTEGDIMAQKDDLGSS